jgi:hypothetical protein
MMARRSYTAIGHAHAHVAGDWAGWGGAGLGRHRSDAAPHGVPGRATVKTGSAKTRLRLRQFALLYPFSRRLFRQRRMRGRPSPAPPQPAQSPFGARTKGLRILQACANSTSGRVGGCWRPAFGAAEDRAGATESKPKAQLRASEAQRPKEAHMFERSEFMRFPSTPSWLREPRQGQRRCGPPTTPDTAAPTRTKNTSALSFSFETAQ